MPRAPIPIAGRTVAVTGGARGIGAAIAEELRRRGAHVVTGDLEGADHVLDVTSRASFAAFLGAAGPVDALVNNAGVMHVGPFVEESEDWTRRQVDVNFLGVVNGMQAVLPQMLARRSGHIVNVASAAARIGVRREAVYSATKHAVAGLSEAVRLELRGSGVSLSLVMPGLVETELAAGTTGARGTLVLQPSDVAVAIAGALERPRFDVWVPRGYGALDRALAPMPRIVREGLLKALGSERGAAAATPETRAAYEARMAALVDRAQRGGRG